MGRRARAHAAVAVAALTGALVACSADVPQTGIRSSTAVTPSAPATPSASVAAPAPTEPVAIATGLAVPWSVAFVGDTPLVSERGGRIVELGAGGAVREVGRIEGVWAQAEAGLLGLAVRGDALYVYSTAEGGNRVERYALTGSAGSLGLGARETLLEGIPAGRTHDGGRIAFGPDGMLYVATGDAGYGGNAADLASLGGKILRIDPDGAVPADNPFPGSPVYSLGHRNVQGLAWAEDGTLFASEFGLDTWDELNVIVAGGDYGWPEVEGIAGDGRFIDPVQVWEPERASPSGIAIADDTIYLANLRGRVLRAVPVADPSTGADLYQDAFGRLRDVTLAPDGTLWLLTNNTDGRGDPAPDDDRVLSVPLP